jgi:hypothetical protein
MFWEDGLVIGEFQIYLFGPAENLLQAERPPQRVVIWKHCGLQSDGTASITDPVIHLQSYFPRNPIPENDGLPGQRLGVYEKLQ